MFRKVAAVARLRKKDFKKPDKQPRTYDQRTFELDGMMYMEIQFKDKVIKTPVYIKMDAHDQLLLSEGLCRQLEIVSYDPAVEVSTLSVSPGWTVLVEPFLTPLSLEGGPLLS